MRVVCAACNTHYADIPADLTGPEQLHLSDVLASGHASRCTATAAEHAAGLEWVQAMNQALDGT